MSTTDLQLKDWISRIENNLGKEEWLTVYSHYRKESDKVTFYCALIPDDSVKQSLNNPSWDLTIGHGFPEFTFSYEEDKEVARYSRLPESGIEPLIFARDFYGVKKSYKEVSEEFRFYFNLYEDKDNRKFIVIDDDGDEVDVVIITDTEIRIKLRYIKEFLSVKSMSLALYFDIARFSGKTLKELGYKESNETIKKHDVVYVIAKSDSFITRDDQKSSGWVMGKKIITGLKDFKPTLIKETGEYEDFIIGVDEEGREVIHTCNPEMLSNNFGKNPREPHFLTPVFFQKEVLSEYYAHPDKYSVKDGRLYCTGLWCLKMDNNHFDHVMVFLGYLGQSLSLKEQKRWKRFNITPQELKISKAEFQRGILGQFADPDMSDLYFKQKFKMFQEKWQKKYGWFLFKPLRTGDEHFFNTLRVPLTDSQKEFDEQVLAITKTMIDSLNEADLVKEVELQKDGAKGIDKLEGFLTSSGCEFEGLIEFLRDLQALRSTGSAHLKGKNYDKALKRIAGKEKNFKIIFDEILANVIRVLNTLETHLLD